MIKRAILNPNLYFFGQISNLDNHGFNSEIKKVDTDLSPSKFNTDLINQILVKARIAKAKCGFFIFVIYLTAFGSGLISFINH